MKMEQTRYSIEIVPEGPSDEAFLEHVLGLKREGDVAEVRRVAPFGLSGSWAFAEVRAVLQGAGDPK